MKKLFVTILALTLVLTFAACSSSKDDTNDKLPTTGESSETQSNEETKTEPLKSSDVTLAEQVIYEGNNLKITAKGLDYDDFFGPSIKVLIENNSENNITVQARNSNINDLMIDTVFSAEVAAGKKVNDTITFFSSYLEDAGITTIKTIEFSIHVIDSDSWDDILDTNTISLTTTADESSVQKYDDSGFIAYDADGVKVVVKKLNSSDSFWGSDLYLYLENNSTKDITVQARDVSINGFMVDPMFSCEILTGKKAFDTMTFMESDLTDNDITDIVDLELKLHIFDTESWDTIKDTDTIKVSFN